MTSVLHVFFLALALDVYPEVPPWTMSGSPSHSDLRQAQWTAWEPGKISSALTSPLDPDSTVSPASGNEETIGDIREPLTRGFLPSEPELPDFFFSKNLQLILALQCFSWKISEHA